MSGGWPTPFEGTSDAALTKTRRQLVEVSAIALTYGYNNAHRELGEVLADVLDEQERRATATPLTLAEMSPTEVGS